METIPAVVPPLHRADSRNRHCASNTALRWLAAGWQDLLVQPTPSLIYGAIVFVISAGIVFGLFTLGWDGILFPALAGFMIVGPILAIALYEKSRRIAVGQRVSVRQMVFVRPPSGGQILFPGILLCLLLLAWMRAAVIVYALFFGLRPFAGLQHIAVVLFTTLDGGAMLVVGIVIGAVFAAFAFAISVFSMPMLLEERVDALTAMGRSMALAWNNLPVMLAWGAIVLVLFLFSLATGLLGLIVVFPVLGHGTWHAFRAIRPKTWDAS
jgi:uncharacterized membrane protein